MRSTMSRVEQLVAGHVDSSSSTGALAGDDCRSASQSCTPSGAAKGLRDTRIVRGLATGTAGGRPCLGPGAVASHASAARLWHFVHRPEDSVDVTCRGRLHATAVGVIIAPQMLPDEDVSKRSGIPCTSFERTLVRLHDAAVAVPTGSRARRRSPHGRCVPRSATPMLRTAGFRSSSPTRGDQAAPFATRCEFRSGRKCLGTRDPPGDP